MERSYILGSLLCHATNISERCLANIEEFAPNFVKDLYSFVE